MSLPLPAAVLALALSAGPSLAAVRVSEGWVRATPVGAPTAAAYVTLVNDGRAPDRLLGGSTPAATRLGVHSMSMAGGVMRMRAMGEGLPLPPGATVRLEPGGDHLMLSGLKQPLRAGQTVRLALTLQTGGTVRATLPVLNQEPRHEP